MEEILRHCVPLNDKGNDVPLNDIGRVNAPYQWQKEMNAPHQWQEKNEYYSERQGGEHSFELQRESMPLSNDRGKVSMGIHHN